MPANLPFWAIRQRRKPGDPDFPDHGDPGAYRYWRVRSTGGGSEGNGISFSEWKLQVAGEGAVSLAGKTITNLGDAFHLSYPIENINDGVAETVAGENIAHIQGADVVFDVSVDMDEARAVTAFLIAPQGTTGSLLYNTPLNLACYASHDGSEWVLLTSFADISTGIPAWDAGTYREFLVQG